MQLFSGHVAHKEGEHLAPHRVLAVATGLGTGEGEITEGSSWAEQDTSTLCSHSGPLVPLGAFSVSAQVWHKLRLVGGTRAGQSDSKARRVCQEISQGLKSYQH